MIDSSPQGNLCGPNADPGLQKHLEIKLSELRLYPNPASNLLTIEATTEIVGVELHDLTGKLIFSEHYPQAVRTTAVHLTGIADGVYITSVWTSQGLERNTLIVHANR